MGNQGGNDRNAGSQGENAGNQGGNDWNAGNQGGNAGIWGWEWEDQGDNLRIGVEMMNKKCRKG